MSPRNLNHHSFEDLLPSIHRQIYLSHRRKSKKSTLIGSQVSYGEAVKANNSSTRRAFNVDPSLPSYVIIFKYRTRQALILSKIIEEKSVVEKEREEQEDVKPFASSSKRKLDSAKEKAVVVEDVKPSKKKPRSSAGSSKDTAIDLTKL